MTTTTVQAWVEALAIPTYDIGIPDKNPMFLEKRVYQGSSGAVYPYPVIDRVFDQLHEKLYTAVFLENRYLKIMILPELGGRVQMAQDKTNGYHFIYYNRVIKPALVGLAGPWISGGIEFNWPQHHRPSTFEPLDWCIEQHPDGSKTIWCSEIERMSFTKGMHGFTLHPDRAYLEISVQLFNRTSEAQTFLWWANPAVHVNDQYQSVFPPDVHAVMDHGKRDVSDFPIATGTYYKVNYAPGTDISRYKNISVPMSYMAAHSDFDFVGDYDHGQQAGMLHVANHHLVPGKKQWTWGNGDFGQAWDRQLTDADGPYIELMCGAFTDNQPDFSWIMPGEEKRFTQIFLPYKLIGPAHNASKEAIVHLDIDGDLAQIGVYTTQPQEVTVTLQYTGNLIWQQRAQLSPEHVLREAVQLPAQAQPTMLLLRVIDAQTNRELLAYRPLAKENMPIPTPASPVKPADQIESNEELFVIGLHLEQYRHATYAPEAYYAEALRRDRLDSRCNNAQGLLLYRRGMFVQAEAYFRTAVESLTRRNPNPYDGEPFYNLGLALRMQGRYQEAYAAFYKAAWNAAWQDSAYFELARLAARSGDDAQALDLVSSALRRNWSHHKARHLQIALLRRSGQFAEAAKTIAIAGEMDLMDYGVWWERNLLSREGPQPVAAELYTTDRINHLSWESSTDQAAQGHTHRSIELAIDYLHAGFFSEALAVLQSAPGSDPMLSYFAGLCHAQRGDLAAARSAFQYAATLSPDYCFPHRLESVLVLQSALLLNPNDARAPYYLGNFWYAHRRYSEAIACWEQARALDPQFPTVHRNLGLAYFNKLADPQRARAAYEQAFALDQHDARVFFELDQLDKRLNFSPQQRLARLEQHLDLVERRDDLMIEYITVLNMQGRSQDACMLLLKRQFHPWEGGEGKTPAQYRISLIEQSKTLSAAGDDAAAIALLRRATVYPHNLGEGKLPNTLENDIYYLLGRAYTRQGQMADAQACFEWATIGTIEPTSSMYYNDQPPDMIFYQGLALQQLGHTAEAQHTFQKLVDYGQLHLNDDVKMDFFAVSLPTFLVFDEDLNLRNQIHCHYMIGLGLLGMGNAVESQQHFDQVLALDANHQGAHIHRVFEITQ